jgi:hypothetical protein
MSTDLIAKPRNIEFIDCGSAFLQPQHDERQKDTHNAISNGHIFATFLSESAEK